MLGLFRKPQEMHIINKRSRACLQMIDQGDSPPRRDFQAGPQLLEQMLCVNAGRYELYILAKHLAKDLLATLVNQDDAAQVHNTGQ